MDSGDGDGGMQDGSSGDDATNGGAGDGTMDDGNGDGSMDDSGSMDGGAGSLPDHAALAGIESEPVLGKLDRSAVIVAFEDPSCPSCGRFERTTYPSIVSNLVESGQAGFVYRGYPVVYQWGEHACRALEATYAADEGAFWDLKDHYYANQRAFGTDNVYDRTESFLSENTGVDATAVVDRARNGEYDAAVQADLDAGRQAGAGGVPYFFLFKDGEFRTEISGPQDYAVFENALGL